MIKSPKSWSIFHLRNYHEDKHPFNFKRHSIIYSALDEVSLFNLDKKILIQPEHFYFIPPGTSYHLDKKYTTAFVFQFDQDLFVDRLELLYQIKNGSLFDNPIGTAVRNDFFPYELILEHYYLPVRRPGASQLIRKTSLLNFLEFILIRILLSSDSEIKKFSSASYEKDIVDRFLFILREEKTINFNATYYANQLNITKRTLDNAVKETFGCTAKNYLVSKAVEQAKTLLITTDEPIKIISMEIGFSQESNFVNFFKKHTGVTPGQFRAELEKGGPELNFMYEKGDR